MTKQELVNQLKIKNLEKRIKYCEIIRDKNKPFKENVKTPSTKQAIKVCLESKKLGQRRIDGLKAMIKEINDEKKK